MFDANDTGLVVKAMEGTIQYGTGRAASAIGKTMAGKSGTANDNKAVSFIGFTPSTLTMFAIWNPGANGEALELPTINGYYKGMGYPAVLFTNYMSRALENVADEKFPDVTDSGKIGGPDGTWGTGSQYSSWGQQRPVAEREFAGRQQERRPVVAERHAVWRRVGLAVDDAADRQRFEWQRQWIGRQRVRWQRRERRQQRE